MSSGCDVRATSHRQIGPPIVSLLRNWARCPRSLRTKITQTRQNDARGNQPEESLPRLRRRGAEDQRLGDADVRCGDLPVDHRGGPRREPEAPHPDDGAIFMEKICENCGSKRKYLGRRPEMLRCCSVRCSCFRHGNVHGGAKDSPYFDKWGPITDQDPWETTSFPTLVRMPEP